MMVRCGKNHITWRYTERIHVPDLDRPHYKSIVQISNVVHLMITGKDGVSRMWYQVFSAAGRTAIQMTRMRVSVTSMHVLSAKTWTAMAGLTVKAIVGMKQTMSTPSILIPARMKLVATGQIMIVIPSHMTMEVTAFRRHLHLLQRLVLRQRQLQLLADVVAEAVAWSVVPTRYVPQALILTTALAYVSVLFLRFWLTSQGQGSNSRTLQTALTSI